MTGSGQNQPAPRLHLLNGPNRGARFVLRPGLNRVGRAETNDIVLEDRSVSGLHCELEVSPFAVRVRDCGSTNGTFIDRQPVTQAELKDGQALTLGGVQLRVEVPQVEISIPTLPAPDTLEPPTLADGSPACWNNHGALAVWTCRQCGRGWCDGCVHRLGLEGKGNRLFCPSCSGLCDVAAAVGAAQRDSAWNRLVRYVRRGLRWR